MPTYEYECQACGHHFEKFQSITAPSIRKCPACKKLKLRRLIGAGAGIIFKGSGFYQTDYRSESYRKAAAKENGASSKSGDSKGAAKTDKPSASGSNSTGTSSSAGKKSSSAGKPASAGKPKNASGGKNN